MNLNEEVGRRLKSIREYFGDSQKKFAEKVDVKQNNISRYETGKLSVSNEVLGYLYDNGINLNWLLSGEGQMFHEDICDCDSVSVVDDFEESIYRDPRGREMNFDQNGVVMVPMFAQKVSAGAGQELLEDGLDTFKSVPVLEQILYPYKTTEVKAIQVKGDSMTGVNIFSGDIVFFIPNKIEGDGIYVISTFEEIKVKRIFRTVINGERIIEVISENSNYRTETFPYESENLKILGKVLGWVHKHPY